MDNNLTPEEIEGFQTNGYIVLRNFLYEKFCADYVDEIWQVISSAPWLDNERVTPPPDGPFSQLKGKGVSEANKKWLSDLKITGKAADKKWFPGNFSAPGIPPFFHLNHSWELRQSPRLYHTFCELLSCGKTKINRLWVSIDRVSVKPPGMGDQESFYHWDSDPWYWESETYTGLQGMFSLSDGNTFTLFKTTHTDTFRDSFINGPGNTHKPNWLSNGDVGKKEGMIVFNKVQSEWLDKQNLKTVITLNRGDIIIWSNRLLHLASKNKSNQMRYAQYIQYDPAGVVDGIPQNPELLPKGDREELLEAITKYQSLYKKNPLPPSNIPIDNITVVNDRIRSFNDGHAPLFYPSGGLTNNSMRPNIWRSQFKNLNAAYAKRFKHTEEMPTHKRITYQNGKNFYEKDGVLEPTIEVIEWKVKHTPLYTPPTLTYLGRLLLGLESWITNERYYLTEC
jgi:hypothetical protein